MEVRIAGASIGEPVEVVATYVREREGDIRGYDLFEQDSRNAISARDVLATKHVESGIDGGNVQYFIDNSPNAPWDLVPLDAQLADADPEEEEGLYDHAEELYRHFFSGRRRGMSAAKIHKVLHMKRPHLYPLLDGRLRHIYDEMANDVSKQVQGRRGRRGRLYWAAIRLDVIDNADAFATIRDQLADRDEPESLAQHLSDVRLHDILAWELVAHLRRGR